MMPYLGKQTLIRSGSYEDLADADIAVMTACGKICDEDRLQELSGSIAVIDRILPEVQKNHFKGTMIVLTNPCDLIAWYISQKIDADVIGTGTALDSARLRARVAETLGLAPSDIQGYCIGEHGDSQTIVWSQMRAGGLPWNSFLQKSRRRRSRRRPLLQDVRSPFIKEAQNLALACPPSRSSRLSWEMNTRSFPAL